MAKFITTSGTSHYIEEIIIKAKKKLVIVSPFLKLNPLLTERLKDADARGVQMTYVYGKKELSKKQRDTLDSLTNLQILFCSNLHAKCYFNENIMIIGSMNLYDFSVMNNREMGVLIDGDEDKEIYDDGVMEANSIIANSEKKKELVEKEDVELTAGYKSTTNFHLPRLKALFERHYPKIKTILKDDLKASNFPAKGITLVVNGRIDFKFDEEDFYESFKNRNAKILEKSFPKIRFYWNRLQLNIYKEENSNLRVNAKDLKAYSDKCFAIIQKIDDLVLEQMST